MNETFLNAIEVIQAILAPAIGISATALLLLSMQSRYSLIINRIRLLNEERRKYYKRIANNEEPGAYEQIRYSSITNQLQRLFVRCKELRNAILYIQGSILLFVITSILIAINIFYSSELLRKLPLVIFSIGMLSVLIGIVYSAKDVINSYKIAEIEVKGDD